MFHPSAHAHRPESRADTSVSWIESVAGSRAVWRLELPEVSASASPDAESGVTAPDSSDFILECGWEGTESGDAGTCAAYPASETLDVELRRRLADLRVSQGAAHSTTVTVRFFEEAEAVRPSGELDTLLQLASLARAAFDQRAAALTGEAKEKHAKMMTRMPAPMPDEMLCEVFDPATATFAHRLHTALRPGDVLQVTSGDYVRHCRGRAAVRP